MRGFSLGARLAAGVLGGNFSRILLSIRLWRAKPALRTRRSVLVAMIGGPPTESVALSGKGRSPRSWAGLPHLRPRQSPAVPACLLARVDPAGFGRGAASPVGLAQERAPGGARRAPGGEGRRDGARRAVGPTTASCRAGVAASAPPSVTVASARRRGECTTMSASEFDVVRDPVIGAGAGPR
jgi:hypothetical protein